jgi:hypothetical protein
VEIRRNIRKSRSRRHRIKKQFKKRMAAFCFAEGPLEED